MELEGKGRVQYDSNLIWENFLFEQNQRVSKVGGSMWKLSDDIELISCLTII